MGKTADILQELIIMAGFMVVINITIIMMAQKRHGII